MISLSHTTRWLRATRRRAFLRATLGAASGYALWPARELWAEPSGGAIPGSLRALNADGKPISLLAPDVTDFRASLRGKLLLPRDEGYEQARRVWNGAFDRHPALIARCADDSDVIHAVNFARSHRLLTAVRGGGHSLSGQSTCEGGLMIDLAPMRAVQVHSTHRTVEAQGGVLLGEVDAASQKFMLATTLGTAPDTGIAGLTLGGGQGRLMRKFGLACDNLIGADVVTADGKLRHASERENADLFWGIRGGGGNFGVATKLEYRLHPIEPRILDGTRGFPLKQARTVIAAMLEVASTAPDELSVGVVLGGEPSPDATASQYISFEASYLGSPGEGERLLEPLKKLGTPVFDDLAPKPYLTAQQGVFGATPPPLPAGLGVYMKTGFLPSVPPALVDRIMAVFENRPPWLDMIVLGALGGAVSRVKPEATAYWNRDAGYDLILAASWQNGADNERNVASARALWKEFEPFTRNYYVNTEPSASESRLRATYGGNYARLVQLKNKFDPTNLFRLNANIKPTGVSGRASP